MIITTFLVGLFALLFVLALVAPLGSLGWWAGWFGEELSVNEIGDADGDGSVVDDWAATLFAAPPAGCAGEPADRQPVDFNKQRTATHYIIYLSGIGAFSGSSIPHEELPFINALRQQLPASCVIADVFPYSVTNVGLTGERLFARVWRYIEAQRPRNPNSLWLFLVVIRNMFQVMVSADRRYGPIYNLGVAKEIWRSLLRHGYRPGTQTPVTLIGASGGGQIAVGVVTYLSKVVDVPIEIISLGGVIASDPGLLRLKQLYHLYGAFDRTEKLGPIFFPGRWPLAFNSAWNRAKKRGLITIKVTGPADHVGKNSQFDQQAFAEDGRSYFQITFDEVLQILRPATVAQ